MPPGPDCAPGRQAQLFHNGNCCAYVAALQNKLLPIVSYYGIVRRRFTYTALTYMVYHQSDSQATIHDPHGQGVRCLCVVL